jgi:hypothetical protein
MKDALTAPADPAVPISAVPGTAYGIGQNDIARFLGEPPRTNREVTVLGVSVAAPTWWGLLLAMYVYILPLVLYVVWVAIAMWDLIRRDELSNGRRIGWMAVVLLVPFLGPIVYYAFGRSPIPVPIRVALTAGAFLVYVAFAALALVIGAS